MRALVVGCVACAVFVFGCNEPPPAREWRASDHEHAPGAPDPARVATAQERSAPAESPETANERASLALWRANCASCHGAEGRGDGPSRAPVMRMANFQDPEWQASRSDGALRAIIALGRGMMPAFGDRIPADGIALLVERIRGFAASEPPGAP